MSKVNLITQAEYSKHRGVSEAAVSKAIKAGRISLIDGKIDPVAADAQWARNSRVRAGRGRPGHVAPAAGAQDPGGASQHIAGRVACSSPATMWWVLMCPPPMRRPQCDWRMARKSPLKAQTRSSCGLRTGACGL